MIIRTFFILFLLQHIISQAQDKVILNNGDTLAVKVNRYDKSEVEFQLEGETVSQGMSILLINSIALSNGRVIKPEVLETDRLATVFGSYKGNCVVKTDNNAFGLSPLISTSFEELIVPDILSKIKMAGTMTGASLAIYKLEERPFSHPQKATVDYYAFVAPSTNFIKENIIGKSFTLLKLDSYKLGQSELISMLNFETIQHSVQFSGDGKVIEDGRIAGSYIITDDIIDLKYEYANKKGKLKVWGGAYKVGSYDKELIQLYSANYDFTYFQNIILKRN